MNTLAHLIRDADRIFHEPEKEASLCRRCLKSNTRSTARDFIECAYMAANDLEREQSSPLCAVLNAASDKLKAIGEAIERLR